MELDDREVAALASACPVAEDLSPLVGDGLLVVHGGNSLARLDEWLRGVPAVTVLVGDPTARDTPSGFDVYVTTRPDPPRRKRWFHWVSRRSRSSSPITSSGVTRASGTAWFSNFAFLKAA